MTQAEPTAPTAPRRRTAGSPGLWVSVALVTGLVVLHLLMAYASSTLPDAVFDAINGLTGPSLGLVVVSVLPAVPLAVVVMVWSRTHTLGALAFGVVMAEALLGHLRGVTVRRLLDGGHVDSAVTFLDRTGWVLAALAPATIVLAWGLARRRGRAWTAGIALAAGLGILLHTRGLGGPGGLAADHPGRNALRLALLVHVVPALVGGLAAWAIQVRTRQR